jgi:predicted phage terminase large subunit-like protein
MADRLEMLSKGEIKRLAISAPPRHGKTELVSVNLPAWHLGHNPYHSVMGTALDAKLAEKNGKRARNTVASVEFRELFKDAKLSEESAAKLVWTLEETLDNKPCPTCGTINWFKKAFGRAVCRTCGSFGQFAGSNTIGEYFGAGINGGIVGRGANLLLIDDPFRDRKQAKSASQRESVWDWYTSAAVPRLEKDGRICVTNTRWHEDDLTGRILRNISDDSEPWTNLVLKAIAEEDEEWELYNPDYIELFGTNKIYRKKGEVLWESKYSKKRIMQIRSDIHSYEFEAQYQQNPHPPEGSLFKRADLRYGNREGDSYLLLDGNTSKRVSISKCIRFVTGDLGYVEGDNNAYTVFCTWDLTPDSDLILMDMYRKQIDGAYHIDVLWNIYHRNNPQEIAVESTGYQIALVQKAILDGLPCKKLEAKGDKEFRALTAASKMESHKFFLLNDLPDLHVIENELAEFPNGTYKDIVDNFAYAAIRAATIMKVFYAAPPPPEKNDFSIMNRRKILEQM